jgi:type IV secretion system protein VirD4
MFGILIIVLVFFAMKWSLKDSMPTNRGLPLFRSIWGKLFNGEKVSGSQFMSSLTQGKFLNARNEGLILDGKGSKRLDLKRSFENVAIISPVGGGKSTRYILPNLCGLDNCSIVATDPSGELYQASSGYLESKAFDVKVLNLADPHYSLNYNTLAKATTYTEIDKLAEVIMRSGHPVTRPEDEIWVSEPQALLTILMTCLQNTGEPEWYNLHNLLYLLQSFGLDGRPLANFIRDNAPDDGGRIYNNLWHSVMDTRRCFLRSSPWLETHLKSSITQILRC